jgi:putative transposase
MPEYRKASHTTFDIKYHIVWTTKYRYRIINKKIGSRLKELIIQGCQSRNINIVNGHIDTDHVHLRLSCPPDLSPSKIVQYLKGRSSRLLQDEFPELKQRYWGQHLWGRGYFCATVGAITEEMIKEYIEKHRDEGDAITIHDEFQS